MKNSKSKKVTKKGEYYFAKGFKVLVSCVKKNRYSLLYNTFLWYTEIEQKACKFTLTWRLLFYNWVLGGKGFLLVLEVTDISYIQQW